MDLPENVAMFLAQRVHTNTRELEGALNRLHGLASVDNQPIDLALAREALGEARPVETQPVRIQDIMNLIAEHFGVKLSDLQGRRRSRAIALPRHIGMYLARRHTSHSLAEIGGFFGGRDHTTVLHAEKLISGRRQSDATLSSQLDRLEATLREP
jgi:chromosomal replication initiator protein